MRCVGGAAPRPDNRSQPYSPIHSPIGCGATSRRGEKQPGLIKADARIRTADPFITSWARSGTQGHWRARLSAIRRSCHAACPPLTPALLTKTRQPRGRRRDGSLVVPPPHHLRQRSRRPARVRVVRHKLLRDAVASREGPARYLPQSEAIPPLDSTRSCATDPATHTFPRRKRREVHRRRMTRAAGCRLNRRLGASAEQRSGERHREQTLAEEMHRAHLGSNRFGTSGCAYKESFTPRYERSLRRSRDLPVSQWPPGTSPGYTAPTCPTAHTGGLTGGCGAGLGSQGTEPQMKGRPLKQADLIRASLQL